MYNSRPHFHFAFAACAIVATLAIAGCTGVVGTGDSPLLPASSTSKDFVASANPTQWPAFRGGFAHGVAASSKIPLRWSTRENVRWSIEVPGSGNSSPVIVDDHIFLTSVTGSEDSAELNLWCFSRSNGQLQWRRRCGRPVGLSHRKNGPASATPTTDGKHIAVCFGEKGLFCFDMQGTRQWQQPLSGYRQQWGTASSPVMVGDLVIQLCDGEEQSHLSAFDKRTGQLVWQTPRDSTGCWSSPVLHWASVDGKSQLEIVVNGTGSEDGSAGRVTAYDPSTGLQRWQVSGTTDIVAPTAVVGKELIVSSSGPNGPVLAIERHLAADDPNRIRWQHPAGGGYVPTGVIVQGLLFLVTDDGELTCHRCDTGELAWHQRLGTSVTASLIAAAGHVLVTCETGEVHVIRAAETYQPVAVNSVNQACLATPAIVDNTIFLRTDRRLFCIANQSSPSDLPLETVDGKPTESTSAKVIPSPSDLPAG